MNANQRRLSWAVGWRADSPLLSRVAAVQTGPNSWIDARLDGSSLALASVQNISPSSDPLRIVQVELGVNGAIANTAPNPSATDMLVTTIQSWLPPAPGNYTLMVRVQNRAGVWRPYTQAVVTVGARRMTPPAPPTCTGLTSAIPTRPAGITLTPTRPPAATLTPRVSPQPTSMWTRPVPPTPGDRQGPTAPTPISPIGGVSANCAQVNLVWSAPFSPLQLCEMHNVRSAF